MLDLPLYNFDFKLNLNIFKNEANNLLLQLNFKNTTDSQKDLDIFS